MAKITTDEGIIIEAVDDTLYLKRIPVSEEYNYGLYSIKYSFEDGSFPAGTWKKIINGESSYCLKDRGDGEHKVFISFAPRKEVHPEYTVEYVYGVHISEENKVTFPA